MDLSEKSTGVSKARWNLNMGILRATLTGPEAFANHFVVKASSIGAISGSSDARRRSGLCLIELFDNTLAEPRWMKAILNLHGDAPGALELKRQQKTRTHG